ncbi:hypothetical protein F5Y15DRAFT_157890 [Xylariaceae sp. FL0016]|nr:hypothetical protein F5Y15DRAFT_157890 [Xylariaceae sp. FL0016]
MIGLKKLLGVQPLYTEYNLQVHVGLYITNLCTYPLSWEKLHGRAGRFSRCLCQCLQIVVAMCEGSLVCLLACFTARVQTKRTGVGHMSDGGIISAMGVVGVLFLPYPDCLTA